MIEDFKEQQRRQGARMRSIMDYTMGIILFGVGIFFIIYRQFNIHISNREPANLDYFIGGLFTVYGIWRIYRGYKKNYNS